MAEESERRQGHRFLHQGIIVTGAASGMGRSIAVRPASEGAQILAVDLRTIDLDESERLQMQAGAILPYSADLREVHTIPSIVERALAEFGGLMGWLIAPVWRTPGPCSK